MSNGPLYHIDFVNSFYFSAAWKEMQLFILKFNKDEWASKLLQYDTGKTAQLIIHEELFYELFWHALIIFQIITGCGNGKYLHINEEIFKLGCDVCRPLVDSAWSQGHEVQLSDGLRLPYRDGCFDSVLSIAGNAST